MQLPLILIAAQIGLLGYVVVSQVSKKRDRDLITMTTFAGLILLVDFQALYVGSELLQFHSEYFLENFITRDGFRLAVFLLFLCTIVIVASYRIARSIKWRSRPKPPRILRHTPLAYAVAIVLMSIFTYYLIDLLGGVEETFMRPGRPVAGQTVWLILLQMGKIPLFYKVAERKKASIVDYFLFGWTFILTMVNHRAFAACDLWQLLVLWNYCRREISRTKFLVGGACALVAVLVAGIVRAREFGYNPEAPLAVYRLLRGGSREGPFDVLAFFYRWNIEAFTGFAGIITHYVQRGITYDYGISYLQLFTHLTPYSVRTGALSGLDAWLVRQYEYNGSIVTPGYEGAFGHFGFVGLLIFSVLLGVVPRWFDHNLRSAYYDRILYGVLAVDILYAIIYDLWLMGLCLLGELFVLYLYRAIALITAGVVRGYDPDRVPGAGGSPLGEAAKPHCG